MKERFQKTRAVLGWLYTIFACGCAALWLVALIVRLTVRDRYDALLGLFYATPWPVLALLAFAAAIGVLPRVKRAGWLLLAGSIACLATWFSVGWQFGAPSTAKGDF